MRTNPIRLRAQPGVPRHSAWTTHVQGSRPLLTPQEQGLGVGQCVFLSVPTSKVVFYLTFCPRQIRDSPLEGYRFACQRFRGSPSSPPVFPNLGPWKLAKQQHQIFHPLTQIHTHISPHTCIHIHLHIVLQSLLNKWK